MDAPQTPEWSKRYSWAQCREPYKNELDTIASQWIEGSLSNAELALEAVRMLSELDWVSQPTGSNRKIPLNDVVGQIKILTEAMLTATMDPKITPDERRKILDVTREQYGPGGELGGGGPR